ncbi:MAG: hypothetical protein KGL39_10745 [Patescibacteria group bacterium]|nr:hypothetical protein [Patescibacteria group bacterium]
MPVAIQLPTLQPTDAPWAYCKDFIVGRVQTLRLSRIGMNVLSMSAPQPDDPRVKFPCVMVTTEDERAERLPGTTEHKDWLLPVRVFLADRDTALRNEREVEWLTWHQQVLNAFDQKPLGRMPGLNLYWVEAHPQVAYDREAAAYRYVVGSVLLKCSTREPRDFNRET